MKLNHVVVLCGSTILGIFTFREEDKKGRNKCFTEQIRQYGICEEDEYDAIFCGYYNSGDTEIIRSDSLLGID